MSETTEPSPASDLILYQTEDGKTRIQCRFEDESLWLTQVQIADLFQKDVKTINEHLLNVYQDKELEENSNDPEIPDRSNRGKTRGGPRDQPLQPPGHSGCWVSRT